MADYTPKATITLKSKASLSTTSLDQKRAAYAWECVQRCTDDYIGLSKAAPALIMSNGLMQTLAFYHSIPKFLELDKVVKRAAGHPRQTRVPTWAGAVTVLTKWPATAG